MATPYAITVLLLFVPVHLAIGLSGDAARVFPALASPGVALALLVVLFAALPLTDLALRRTTRWTAPLYGLLAGALMMLGVTLLNGATARSLAANALMFAPAGIAAGWVLGALRERAR